MDACCGARVPVSEQLHLEVDGKPKIRHAIESASEGGCHQVVVVYSSDDVRDAVDGSAELVNNPKAKTGMASSLQAGLRPMRDENVAAVIPLGAPPLVGSRPTPALSRACPRAGSRPPSPR